MGRSKLLRCVFVAIAGLAAVGCGRKSPSHLTGNKALAERSPEVANSSNPADDWLIVQGNHFIPVVDELGRIMRRARQAFLETQFQSAAAEVRKGADFLRQEMGPASTEEKTKLNASIKEMEELADSLDRNSVTSLEALDRVFAKAHQADMETSWAIVGVEKWFPFVESTQQHLNDASEAFLRRDFRTAATEIRKAEALLKLQASRSALPDRKALEIAWNELEALATKVEAGSVTQMQVLSNSFAAAQYTLAKSHELRALRDWSSKERIKTGYELKAAITHLESGDSWSGHREDSGLSDVLKPAKPLSQKLIEGSTVAKRTVASRIENIGKLIENRDKQVELALK